MRRLGIIHTTKNTIPLIEELIKNEYKMFHFLDESILYTLEKGDSIDNVSENFENLFKMCTDADVDKVLIACSTIGEFTDYSENIYRIDQLLSKGINKDDKVLVLATLETTKQPSLNLFYNADFKIVENAIENARNGHKKKHDELIKEEIYKNLENYDYIILAQASMHGALIDNPKVRSSVQMFDVDFLDE